MQGARKSKGREMDLQHENQRVAKNEISGVRENYRCEKLFYRINSFRKWTELEQHKPGNQLRSSKLLPTPFMSEILRWD